MANGNQTALAKRIIETNVLPEQWSNEAWISALQNTLWPKESPQKIMLACAFAGRYRLDPFANEFYLIQGRPFVGRDGFLRKGTEQDRYVDHTVGKVYAKDTYRVVAGAADHTAEGFGESNRGKFLGAFCTIWTRGDDDVVRARTYEAILSKFPSSLTKKDNWKNDPEGMCVTRAITSGFRATFPLGNLYTVEEAPEVLSGELVEAGPAIVAGTEVVKADIGAKLDEQEVVDAEAAEAEGEETEHAAPDDADDSSASTPDPIMRDQDGNIIGGDDEVPGPAPDGDDEEAELLQALAEKCIESGMKVDGVLDWLADAAGIPKGELGTDHLRQAVDEWDALLSLVQTEEAEAEVEA